MKATKLLLFIMFKQLQV